jgi:hypothetical protein
MSGDVRAWPAIMRRRTAAAYAQCSPSTIDRARRRGELEAAGRVGGRGEWTYAREAIDRWLTGVSADAVAEEPARPRRADVGDWRERIELTARGGR